MNQPDLILAQFHQAFGQGAGSLRVGRRACAALSHRYTDLIRERYAVAWPVIAPQLLERIRAIGRLAAHRAVIAGRTTIGAEELVAAAEAVEQESMCPYCPEWGYEGGTTTTTAREDILAQFHVAFGQGCGAMHASLEAVDALQARYERIIEPELLAGWDTIGVQLLERIRAVGRLAFHKAAEAGHTVITPGVFLEATLVVERASECPWCPVWREVKQAA